MSWKDNMRPGSFRGVPFFATRHNLSGGHRGVHNVFPGRDKGNVEDLGQADDKMPLEIFTLGDDFSARKALVAALNEMGSGELVHPWLGTMTATVDPETRWSLAEEVGEMRKTSFSVTFLKTGSGKYPTVKTDTRAASYSATENARSELLFDFSNTYVTRGQPGFVAKGAGAVVSSAVEAIRNAAKNMRLTGDSLTNFKGGASSLTGALSKMAYDPEALGSSLQGLLSFGGALKSSPGSSITAFNALEDWPASLSTVPNSSGSLATPSRVQQAANQTALVKLVRGTAVLNKMDAVAAANFDSFDTANSATKDVLSLLDGEMGSASDPEFFALGKARSSLIKDIRTRSADLARLVSIELPETRPALKAVYDLYDSLDQLGDLIARNNVRHPSFVPGGVELEVLSNG